MQRKTLVFKRCVLITRLDRLPIRPLIPNWSRSNFSLMKHSSNDWSVPAGMNPDLCPTKHHFSQRKPIPWSSILPGDDRWCRPDPGEGKPQTLQRSPSTLGRFYWMSVGHQHTVPLWHCFLVSQENAFLYFRSCWTEIHSRCSRERLLFS